MTKVLILMKGLPGSGKTTLARRWVAESPNSRARANRDDLRDMLHGGRTGRAGHEAAVTAVQHSAVRALLADGWNVICDDTNLDPAHLNALRQLGRAAGAEVELWDLTDVPIAICTKRDAARAARGDRSVGKAVIREMAAKWLPHLTGGAT